MAIDVSGLEECDPRRAIIQIINECDKSLEECEKKLTIVADYLHQRAEMYRRLAELNGEF